MTPFFLPASTDWPSSVGKNPACELHARHMAFRAKSSLTSAALARAFDTQLLHNAGTEAAIWRFNFPEALMTLTCIDDAEP